jgi:hypothetical protein
MPHPFGYKLGKFLDRHIPRMRTIPDSTPDKPPKISATEYFASRYGEDVRPMLATTHTDTLKAIVHPDDLPIVAIAAAAGNKDAKAVFGETGVSGLDMRGGRIYQEYNSKLQNLQNRMTAYEEMRRSDSALAAMEALITLPIRQASWALEYGDDKKLSEDIEWNLFDPGGMTHSFDDTLREAVLGVLYGFAVHQKVFEEKPLRGGYIGWRKFAERERSTIQKWQFDATGGLRGIEQRGRNPETEQTTDVEIPIERLIVWTWRKEAGNPEGLGAFRQAYKHWYTKGVLETFAAIRIERQACGIPYAVPPPEGADENDFDRVMAMLQRVRTAEDGAMIAPNGWTVGLLTLGPADVPFESHIERQHQSMLQTVLGQFVGLGQGGDSGAWALSRDSSSFFLLSLEGIADWLCECFNRYAIRQICRYNRPETGGKLPRLVHGKVGVRDLDALTRALARIYNEKVSFPSEIEEYIRIEYDLPELPEVAADDDVVEDIVEEDAETQNEEVD